MATLRAKSNADVLNYFEGTNFPTLAPTPIAAVQPAVASYAALLFQDAVGETGQITLPAPAASIFLPDGMTVNPAAIAAIIAAVGAECLSSSGGLLTTYLGGILRGKPPNG
jgi:hypothetical protein